LRALSSASTDPESWLFPLASCSVPWLWKLTNPGWFRLPDTQPCAPNRPGKSASITATDLSIPQDKTMNSRKRRSRIVSFRLSDEEYDSLKNISESYGARNVSEFTRSVAFQAEGDNDGESENLGLALARLKEAVEMLNVSTQKLARVFEDKNGNKSNMDAMDLTTEEPTA